MDKDAYEDLRKFTNNYEITILNDQKRRAKYRRPSWEFFSDPANANIIHDRIHIEHERVYTVEIPESRLKALVDLENMVYNGTTGHHPRELFNAMMTKERLESVIRHNEPAVKLAYEKYSMLLNLVKNDYKGLYD